MSEAYVVPTLPRGATSAVVWRPVHEERNPLIDILVRLIKYKPLGLAGGIILLILLLVGAFASVLAPYGYNDFSLAARLSPPSPAHLLGTDTTVATCSVA